MTGEVTLRGRVLPIGGLKSKLLAAHRAGFKRIVIPKLNERDLSEIPETIRGELEIIAAEDVREVLAAALEPDVLAPTGTTGHGGGTGSGTSTPVSARSR